MPHLTFKNFTSFLFVVTLVFGLGRTAFAAVGHNYTDYCKDLESTTWDTSVGGPSPMGIICPLARFLNVLVLSVAAIFVIFVFIAAIKYALSQGDPKALMASKQTLTTAIAGMLIVIGVWTLLTIIQNVLGLHGNAILNPFEALSYNLAELLIKFGISSTSTP